MRAMLRARGTTRKKELISHFFDAQLQIPPNHRLFPSPILVSLSLSLCVCVCVCVPRGVADHESTPGD